MAASMQRRPVTVALFVVAGLLVWPATVSRVVAEECRFSGACDASAVVPVDDAHFLAASDEDNVLRLYRRDQPGLPVKSFNLGPALDVGLKGKETDIEAAARLGDVAFWITSHARTPSGEERGTRGRFFATRLTGSGDQLTVEVIGRPCKTLIADLIVAPAYARYDLGEAMARSPKEKGGLNIEGLCADGHGGLLIGFRNPIPHKRALIAPLRNPAAVVRGDSPEFGEPIELNLGKLGIRDLTFHDGRVLIVAGPRTGADRFALFAWPGPGAQPRALGIEFTNGFSPEGAVMYPETGWRGVQLLSDDSSRAIGDCDCKDLKDVTRRQFRSRWVGLPPE